VQHNPGQPGKTLLNGTECGRKIFFLGKHYLYLSSMANKIFLILSWWLKFLMIPAFFATRSIFTVK
jgi:hypothetical protein